MPKEYPTGETSSGTLLYEEHGVFLASCEEKVGIAILMFKRDCNAETTTVRQPTMRLKRSVPMRPVAGRSHAAKIRWDGSLHLTELRHEALFAFV